MYSSQTPFLPCSTARSWFSHRHSNYLKMTDVASVLKPACEAEFTMTVPSYSDDMEDFERSSLDQSHFVLVFNCGMLKRVDNFSSSTEQKILEILKSEFLQVVTYAANAHCGSLHDFLLQLWLYYIDFERPVSGSAPFGLPSLWNLQLPEKTEFYRGLSQQMDKALSSDRYGIKIV